ncbi:MAG TPA: DUF3857 domain-containing protein [Candidatus Acidoferrum sp.]|nr:DUF3857 domain-containing protein [Candidatus Acidoferrum sp.]
MNGIRKQLSSTCHALTTDERQKSSLQLLLATLRAGFLCVSVVLALAACAPVFAQDATDDSADEQERDADAGYRYLLKEVSTSINSKGFKTMRIHNRIEIQKPHAVDVVGDVSIPYNAFRSEARVVKAFTRTADGRTVPLQKEAVRDLTPEDVSSYQMYTDVHQLTFSMPALAKGAIMDYEVEIGEKKPVMPGEFWVSEFLDSGVPVCTSRVTVTFPAKREVRIVATNLTAQALAADVTTGNMRTLTWEMKNVPALEYESGMPPYSVVRAQVHLTSVKSWQQVEEWYAGLAKKHVLPDDEIRRQAHTLVKGLTNQLEQIQALYRYASRDVRYVGVELGRSAYEPHAPRETMQNKYGDCKDKAALLVSLLDAIGIPAHIAIVRPNQQGPVNTSLPGPDQFSHAVVYVPRAQGDLWIDATQPFGEVTEHDYSLDDIDALVVGLAGQTFVHVPVPDETHSVHRLIFDLDVHYGGLCTVHEIQEYAGRAAVSERDRRSRLDTDKVRKQLEHNFGSRGGYCRLLNYSFTNPSNDCAPVRVVVDYDSDTFLAATKSGLSVRFDTAELRGWLDVPRPDPASVRKHKRIYPWVARMAHTEEIICRLHLPPGYEVAHSPSDARKELPHGTAEMHFDTPAGIPSLTLRVIHRPARLEPEDLPEVAQQVDQALSRTRASLDIEERANDLIREHRYAKAEAAVVEAVGHDTNSVDGLIRLGTYYKCVGRVYQSQVAFEKALSLSPQDPRGYEMLADTYSGWWGIPGEGFDRKSIMAVYDRALTNVPVRAWTIRRQADTCLLSDQGRPDATNHLDEAERYLRELLKEDAQSYKGLVGLGHVNRLRGNYDEAEDYYRKAARVNPGPVEPRAGIWVAMAYAGRNEEAWNAIAAYYGPGQQSSTEIVRIASLLMLSRRYEAAAQWYNRLVESAARPEVMQKLARLVQKAGRLKREDYDKFYDDSSPEGVAQTLVNAFMMGDTGRVFRCLSPAVNRDEVRRSIQSQATLLRAVKMDLGVLGDLMRSAFDVSKHTLDNGDVEVKLDASKSAVSAFSSYSTVTTFQVQPVSNRWQVITLGEAELDYTTLGRLALEALDRGDMARAVAWQTRLAELSSRPAQARTPTRWAEHLQELAFTNDVLRVKAWAGSGLIGSHDRADVARGAGCLEDVAAAFPDDPQVKMTLAKSEAQLANVRKAAGILDTIALTRLAAPNQLAELASMQLSLEQLDGADKVIARLRDVAPDDEQLPALQASALTYRAKYADAVTTLSGLRSRSKLDSGVSLHTECLAIPLSGDRDAMRELVEHWREPEKPIPGYRPSLSVACLALGLTDEASEQIATMLAEGGMNTDALVGYAEVALARGDTAEVRQLVSVADRVAQHSVEPSRLRSLALVHLALGDYAEAARVYRDDAMHSMSHYSGYWLCMSALASRLAGDPTTAADTLKLAATMQGDSDWPRLAIQYIKGDLSEDEFRRAPARTTTTPFMHASRECEVNCMIGLLKESRHDLPGALAAYEACLATKSVTDLEYSIARFAVRRLRDAHARPVEGKQAGKGST